MEVMNLSNKQQWTLIRKRSRNGERGKEKQYYVPQWKYTIYL